jgi:hypothetical protein
MERIPASVMNAGLSKRRRYNTHRRNCGNEGKFGFTDHYPSPRCDNTQYKRHDAFAVASGRDLVARRLDVVSL